MTLPAEAPAESLPASSSTSGRSSDSDYTLPASVRLLECSPDLQGTHHCTYYLVGTAHVSRESCKDVRSVISKVQPDVVFLELCPERRSMIAERKPEAEEPMQTDASLRQVLTAYRKGQTGLFQAVYSWMLGRVGGALEVQPGEEFRVAVREAKKVGAKVVLGDRPLQITFARTWAALSLWHRLTLLANLLGMGLSASADLREQVEGLKDGDVLTRALQEISKACPTLLRPLLLERNEYMAYMLRRLAQKEGVSKVVAVVGYGHLEGLEECWKQEVDIEEIMRLPPKGKLSRVFTLRRVGLASLCGVAAVSLVLVSKNRTKRQDRARNLPPCLQAAAPVELQPTDYGSPSEEDSTSSKPPNRVLMRLVSLGQNTVQDPSWAGHIQPYQEYEFTESEEKVFRLLEHSMVDTSVAYMRLALASVFQHCALLAVGKPSHLGKLASGVNEATVALFIYLGAHSFRAVYETQGRDIQATLEGLMQLSNVFQEISLIACAVAILTIASAVHHWAYSVWYIGAMSVFAAGARIVLFRNPKLFSKVLASPRVVFLFLKELPINLIKAPFWLIRGAIQKALTTAQEKGYSPPSSSNQIDLMTGVTEHAMETAWPAGKNDGPDVAVSPAAKGFEFNRDQEQVFRLLVVSLYVACMTKLLCFSCESVLLVAEIATGHYEGAASTVMEMLKAVASANLFAAAAVNFNRVVITEGEDLKHLLDGLGKHGLVKLFHKLAYVASLLAAARLIRGALPLLQLITHQSGLFVSGPIPALFEEVAMWLGNVVYILLQ